MGLTDMQIYDSEATGKHSMKLSSTTTIEHEMKKNQKQQLQKVGYLKAQ